MLCILSYQHIYKFLDSIDQPFIVLGTWSPFINLYYLDNHISFVSLEILLHVIKFLQVISSCAAILCMTVILYKMRSIRSPEFSWNRMNIEFLWMNLHAYIHTHSSLYSQFLLQGEFLNGIIVSHHSQYQSENRMKYQNYNERRKQMPFLKLNHSSWTQQVPGLSQITAYLK